MVVGRACLLLAFIASLWAIGAGIAGRRSGRDELVESARRGIYAVLAMAVIAMAILEAAYVRSDFRYALLVVADAGRHPVALVALVMMALALTAIVQEVWRGTGARRASAGEPWALALGRLVSRNRRRYGGYLVHLGVVVLLLGVASRRRSGQPAIAASGPASTPPSTATSSSTDDPR